MEQEVLFKDVQLYIVGWTIFILFVLLVLTYRIQRFGKKHPEIFQPDNTREDKQKLLQKAEWRRQYHNQTMVAISTMFVWMIGIIVICLHFDSSTATGRSYFLLVFTALAGVWILSQIKRKQKK